MIRNILLLVIMATIHISGYSQKAVTTPKAEKYWFDIGLGPYFGTDGNDGGAFNFSVNVLPTDSLLYKFRFTYCTELTLFPPHPVEEFISIGAMLGKGFTANHCHIYFSGGLGLTRGIKRGKIIAPAPIQTGGGFNFGDNRIYERIDFTSPSLPLEIDMLFKPFANLGLGVAIFGDLNLKKSLFGGVVKIAIGKLKAKE